MSIRILAGMLLLLSPQVVQAQTQDHAPSKLESSKALSQDKPKSESWTYVDPTTKFGSYHEVLVENSAVYTGPEADFGKMSPENRAKYAADFTGVVRSELGKRFALAGRRGPGVLVIKFTLIEMKDTVGGVATVTRVLPLGLATSALKSIAGKPGTMTGSVLAAVEFIDGGSGKLIAAAVRRRSPDALNIKSTLSTEETVKAVAGEFGRRLGDAMAEAGVARR